MKCFSTVKPLAALAVFALLPFGAPPAAAQQRGGAAAPAATADDPAKKPTPRLADGHPDLNGFWATGRGPDTPVGSGFGTRNANIKPAIRDEQLREVRRYSASWQHR